MNFTPHIALANVRGSFDSFWNRSPALFYALFLYLGAVAAFSWHVGVLVPMLFLAIFHSTVQKWRLLLGLLGFVLFWLYSASHVVYPPAWGDSRVGTAIFEITDMVHEMRYGRAYCKYKVCVHSFDAEDKSFIAKNIPCKLVWNHPATRPKADSLYRAQATLYEHNGNWTLKLGRDPYLQKVGRTYSLVEWRLQAKNAVKRLLASYLAPTETRDFLEGVLIGEFHDAHLACSLGRFGLQHITVVSGFHFSLIAIILAAFLRLIFPWKYTNICLVLGVTSYLFFIGPSPSVLRAWMAVSVLFTGKIFERASNGMNALGLGLIVVLCWDPASVLQLGFTLSFLATFAILLFYPQVEGALRACFPKRSASDILKMPFSEQLFFVLLTFFISSLALVASVSILMLPMSLYCFQQFPVLGIVYNCFFPFLVSVAVFIVCLAFLFSWIPPFAAFFFTVGAFLLDIALTLVIHAPTWCDITLRVESMCGLWLVLYLCLMCAMGIILYDRDKSRLGNLAF